MSKDQEALNLLQKTMENNFRIMSAMFDMNNGVIKIPKELYDKTDYNDFYITGKVVGNNIEFTKKKGMSNHGKSIINKENNNE